MEITLKDSNHCNHQWFHRSLCVDQGQVGLFKRNQNIIGSNNCEATALCRISIKSHVSMLYWNIWLPILRNILLEYKFLFTQYYRRSLCVRCKWSHTVVPEWSGSHRGCNIFYKFIVTFVFGFRFPHKRSICK